VLSNEEHSLLEEVLLYKCDGGCAYYGYCGNEIFARRFLGFLVSLTLDMYVLLQ